MKRSGSKAGAFWCCVLILLLVPVRTALAQTATQFETPPTLRAQELAPASLLKGNGFHVDEEVPTDGLTAHFTLRSDVGTFKADGLEMLRIRVAEIPAITELNQTSKTKVFAQALATNAAAPVAAAGQMVMHPVDTVKGLPAGVGRFFGRVGLGAQKIKEAATTPEEASAGEKAGQLATRTFHTTRDVLGYEQERRGLAKKLHVDPYTTRVVSAWVYDTPRADLIVQDEKGLRALKVSEKDIHAFMRNPIFPLSVQTAFISNLQRLSGVPESVNAVVLASTSESEEQARFLTDAVGMLARHHETQTPIVKIIVRKTIVGQDRNGAIVVEAPVDYVPWTEPVSYFAHRTDLQSSRRTIWLTGQFSPHAKKNFQALGWAINEHVNPIPDSHNEP